MCTDKLLHGLADLSQDIGTVSTLFFCHGCCDWHTLQLNSSGRGANGKRSYNLSTSSLSQRDCSVWQLCLSIKKANIGFLSLRTPVSGQHDDLVALEGLYNCT